MAEIRETASGVIQPVLKTHLYPPLNGQRGPSSGLEWDFSEMLIPARENFYKQG